MKEVINKIQNWKNSSRRITYLIVYSISFIFISIIIFSSFIVKGNSLIDNGDAYNQFYPVMVYVGDYWRTFLSGTEHILVQFDFSLGMGEAVFPVLMGHGFGNILMLLSIFVSDKFTVYLYDFIVLLSLYICGLTFSAYCLWHHKRLSVTLAGALSYTFTMWSLVEGIHAIGHIYPIMILPLVALGIDQITFSDKRRKFSKVFILAIFIQALSGFYFLYMQTIFVAIYFLIRFIFSGKREINFLSFIQKLFLIVGQYIIGIMMASVMFIPSVIGYFESTRKIGGSNIHLSDLLIYSNLDDYFSYFRNLIIPNAWERGMGITVVMALCLFCYLSTRQRNKDIKILIILALVGLFLPFVSFIMSGFTLGFNRWIYILFFFCSYCLVLTLDQLKYMSSRKLFLGTLFLLCSILFNLASNGYTKESILRFIYYLVLLVFTIIIIKQSKISSVYALCVFIILNLSINGFIVMGPRVLGGTGLSANCMTREDVYNGIFNNRVGKLNLKKSGDEFYRIDTFDSCYGAAQIQRYNGTVEYYSIINDYVSEFYKEMAISPAYRSSITLKGLDGRSILETLLSVKYYDITKYIDNKAERKLISNDNMLPLGFTYDQYMSRERFQKLNTLERQEAMLQGVILEETDSIKGYNEVCLCNNSRELSCDITYSNVNKTDNAIGVDASSTILVKTDIPTSEGELYLNLKEFQVIEPRTSEFMVNGEEVLSINENFPDDLWIKVDDLGNINNTISINFNQAGKYSLSHISVYWYSLEDYYKEVNSRQEDVLENVVIQTNEIKGSIEIKDNKLLFFSIPYSDGWKAYVDGERIDLMRANIAFMALPLETGSHEIILKYSMPGFKIGSIISSIGILLFIILWILSYRSMREEVTTCENSNY